MPKRSAQVIKAVFVMVFSISAKSSISGSFTTFQPEAKLTSITAPLTTESSIKEGNNWTKLQSETTITKIVLDGNMTTTTDPTAETSYQDELQKATSVPLPKRRNQNELPNVLLIGAQKAGSTAIAGWMHEEGIFLIIFASIKALTFTNNGTITAKANTLPWMRLPRQYCILHECTKSILKMIQKQ